MLIMTGIGLIIASFSSKSILSIPSLLKDDKEKATKFKLILPKGALLSIVIISICINVTEGSMTDWASVYMKEIVQTSPFLLVGDFLATHPVWHWEDCLVIALFRYMEK